MPCSRAVGRSQAKLRLELHRQFCQAVELVEEVTGGVTLPLGRVMILRLEREREGRAIFLPLPAFGLRLRFGQDARDSVSVIQPLRVLVQKRIQIRFCELHPFLQGADSALASVSLKPFLKLAVRHDFLCLEADGSRVPCVTDGKLGPGLGEGRAAVSFVGAAF